MSNKTHTCYVCGDDVAQEALAYECMCYHPNTNMQLRGICDAHNPVPERSSWKENPDSNHHLRKIVKPTDEQKAFWADVDKNLPNWQGFIIRTVNGNEMIEFSRNDDPPSDMTEEQYHKIRETNLDHFTKFYTVKRPLFL